MGDRLRVGRSEMTCLVCGETTSENFCRRCNDDDEEGDEEGRRKRHNWQRDLGKVAPTLVPTVSYLREGEFVLVG